MDSKTSLPFFIVIMLVMCSCGKNKNTIANAEDITSKPIDSLLAKPGTVVLEAENELCTRGWPLDSVPGITVEVAEADREYFKYLKNLTPYKQYKALQNTYKQYRQIAKEINLPANATIIEYKPLEKQGIKHRAVAVWMLDAQVGIEEDDELLVGRTWGAGYFTGLVRVSLVATDKKAIINTIVFRDMYYDDDCFTIPFTFGDTEKSPSRFYSHSEPALKTKGRVEVLFFKDCDNDGRALEFLFYEHIGTRYGFKTMYAYRPEKDSLYNYNVNIRGFYYDSMGRYKGADTINSVWVDEGFEYPIENKPVEFVNGIFMIIGDVENGLPVFRMKYNAETKTIEGTKHWYDYRYVLKNEEKFKKYE